MWKWLHPYAKPETQYRICGKLSPLFAFLTLILLGVGIVWGLAFAPADYQQGNSFELCMCMCRQRFGQWVCTVQWRLRLWLPLCGKLSKLISQ